MRNVLATITLGRFALFLALILPLLAVNLSLRYSAPIFLFLPVFLFAVPIIGHRLLANPIPIFCVFLLVIVNLDFFKLAEPGGVRITVDILISSSLLYALLIRIGLERRQFWVEGVGKAYLVFLGVTFISVIFSVNIVFSAKNFVRDVEYLLIFYFVTGLPLTPIDRRRMVGAVLLSTLVPCFTSIIGLVFNLPMFYGFESPVGGGETVARVEGTLGHPGPLGHYLCMTGVLTLAMIIDGRWFRRVYLVPLFALIMTVFYLTFSRTSWVEFMAAVPVLIWVMGHRKKLVYGLPAALVGMIVLLPNFWARWENALLTTESNSFMWRVGLWMHALSKFPQRPIFGSGPATFNEYVAYSTGFNAHHTWVNILIEGGLVGIVAFAVLMIVIGKTLMRRLRMTGPRPDPLIAGTYGVFVSFMVGAWAGMPFSLPAVTVYFWTLVALSLNPLPVSKSAP